MVNARSGALENPARPFILSVFCYVFCTVHGPIVYRLGHILLKDGSGVRLSVGSHRQISQH